MALSKPTSTNPKGKLEHVQLVWTDFSNLTRCRAMTLELLKSYASSGFSICAGIMSLPNTKDVTIENHVGEVRLVPDLETLVQVPWYEGNNTSLCFANLRKPNGTPWDHCPRTFVQKQSEMLFKETMCSVNLGFELEFFIYHKSTGQPVDTTVAFETKSLRGKYWTILTHIVETLEELQIPVFSYHSESGHGQYEISIGPFWGSKLSTVEMGDALVLARQTIYNVVESYDDLFATFVPKPMEGQCGSGCHVHISLENAEESVLNSFIAGIYTHLPSLLPLLIPTMNSFERIKPGCWSGAYHCIGTENKEAPIRLIRNIESGKLERFELKTPDSTSNPYLMIGSIIGSGIDGIQRNAILPQEINIDPSLIPECDRPKKLPTGLPEALEFFKQSSFIQGLLGQEVYDLIPKMRQVEIDYWNLLDLQKESRLKFLMSRY